MDRTENLDNERQDTGGKAVERKYTDFTVRTNGELKTLHRIYALSFCHIWAQADDKEKSYNTYFQFGRFIH